MKIPRRIIKKLSAKYGELIGKGSFSFIFRKSGEDFVTVFSRDKIKECWAYFGTPKYYGGKEIPAGIFPEIKFLDENDENGQEIPELENFPEYKFYRMRYFPKVKSLKSALKPRQWELYKVLREIFHKGMFISNNWERINKYRQLFDEKLAGFLSELPGENSENAANSDESAANYAEIMNAAMDSLINFGDSISFEIFPRNVAASESGELILLDCFFFRKDLKL